MPWSKLCGTYAFHRKILEVGNEGAGAHARMISYAAENLTGGKVSRSAALTIASQVLLDRLVEVALLDRDGDGFVVHDYSDYNPTGPALEARRAEIRVKRSEAGRRGAAARWADGKPDGKSDGKRDDKGDGKKMPTSPSPILSPKVTEIAPPPAPPPRPTVVKAKRQTKHSEEEIADKTAVVDAFIHGVEGKKGITPTLTHTADHAAAFALVKAYGRDEACAIVTRALESPFVLNDNCTLRYVASKADTWRGSSPRKPGAAPKQELKGEDWATEYVNGTH